MTKERGLLQGCAYSPILFGKVAEIMVEKLIMEEDGEVVEVFVYGDDAIIIGKTKQWRIIRMKKKKLLQKLSEPGLNVAEQKTRHVKWNL